MEDMLHVLCIVKKYIGVVFKNHVFLLLPDFHKTPLHRTFYSVPHRVRSLPSVRQSL